MRYYTVYRTIHVSNCDHARSQTSINKINKYIKLNQPQLKQPKRTYITSNNQ